MAGYINHPKPDSICDHGDNTEMPITEFLSIPNFTTMSDETPSDVVYQAINRNFPVDKEFPVPCFYSRLSLNLVLFSDRKDDPSICPCQGSCHSATWSGYCKTHTYLSQSAFLLYLICKSFNQTDKDRATQICMIVR